MLKTKQNKTKNKIKDESPTLVSRLKLHQTWRSFVSTQIVASTSVDNLIQPLTAVYSHVYLNHCTLDNLKQPSTIVYGTIQSVHE